MVERVVFAGIVGHGRERGRKLGFPTANLEVGKEVEDELARGVFVGTVCWEDGPELEALVNIGSRPTFSERNLSLEVHVLDFTGDLYGKRLAVKLLQKLRDECRFAGAEELIAQIRSDIEQARTVLANNKINHQQREVKPCRSSARNKEN
jgi:riboflavin kinase / FMN adenylyltransferase